MMRAQYHRKSKKQGEQFSQVLENQEQMVSHVEHFVQIQMQPGVVWVTVLHWTMSSIFIGLMMFPCVCLQMYWTMWKSGHMEMLP